MKCPKCGYELAEVHLYCDNCGEEIRIVPDFEPEIEKEMNETLSSLFVELTEEKEHEEGPAQVSVKKQRRVILSVCCFLVVAGICIAGKFFTV